MINSVTAEFQTVLKFRLSAIGSLYLTAAKNYIQITENMKIKSMSKPPTFKRFGNDEMKD
jgi:hypothetical protein